MCVCVCASIKSQQLKPSFNRMKFLGDDCDVSKPNQILFL